MPYVFGTLDALELAQHRNRITFFGVRSYVATSIVESQLAWSPERLQTRDGVENLGRWFRDWQNTNADGPRVVTGANCHGQWGCPHSVPPNQHRSFRCVCRQKPLNPMI